MNILKSIKKNARKNGTIMTNNPKADELTILFNKMFYLPKNKELESSFVAQVITRGKEGSERVGLHASSIIKSEDYCIRKQVLSLVYQQAQGEELSVGIKRIFEEGNAIHEKWQRLFLRAGYSRVKDLDFTQYKNEWMLSFTPDIICDIPGFGKMVGEIKSVNAYQYEKMTHHPSASKQLQWYMYLTGIHKGFVLNENKNTQDFKIEYYEFDENVVKPFIEKITEIMKAYKNFIKNKKMATKPYIATSPDCDFCDKCAMKNACWNIGFGRVKLKGGK